MLTTVLILTDTHSSRQIQVQVVQPGTLECMPIYCMALETWRSRDSRETLLERTGSQRALSFLESRARDAGKPAGPERREEGNTPPASGIF